MTTALTPGLPVRGEVTRGWATQRFQKVTKKKLKSEKFKNGTCEVFECFPVHLEPERPALHRNVHRGKVHTRGHHRDRARRD